MAPTRIVIGQTGDFLTVADAKDAAGQRQWERATQAAIAFAQEPSSAVGAKLLAIIGGRSNIGDPRQPDWLPNLPATHRVAVLQELQQLVGSWLDQTAATGGPVVETVVAESGTIVRVPTTKSATATAAALRLAAGQAGPQRGELLAKAAIAEREAADAAAEGRRLEAAWLARAQRRIDAGRARALARARSKAAAKASTSARGDLVADQPAMLFKAAGSDTVKAAVADRVKASTADAVKAAFAPLEAELSQLGRRLELEERRVAAEVAARPPAGARRTEADGLHEKAERYRQLAAMPGMAMSDVATLERAASALEQQAGG